MVGRVKRPLLLVALLLLAGCKKNDSESLAGRVLFVANGSYDASADQRVRLGHGLRRVQWQTKPPLDAGQVTVDYDSDLRPSAWNMTLSQPKVTAEVLLAGSQHKQVNVGAKSGFLVTSGQLKDVLVLPATNELRLISRGYAVQHEAELLPAFGP